MTFFRQSIGGLPGGPGSRSDGVTLYGLDDTIGALIPGPGMSDAQISLGGFTPAATDGRMLTNFGIPLVADAYQRAAGTAYNTSVAATNVEGALSGPTVYPLSLATAPGTLAAGRLNLLGRTLWVRGWGQMTNTATPTLAMAVVLGSTVIATTGVQTTVAITGTTLWRFEAEITTRVVGASGTLFGSGTFTYWSTGPTVGVLWQVANPTPFTAVTLDLTAAYALHLQATWGTSSGSNNLTVHQLAAGLIG
jgi:hypothetical protein